jgi:ribosomal protein S18 acetylase RimI-like enzyme
VTPSAERIRALETAAADALACRERIDDDGWRLRFNDGVTRRGNSVFPQSTGHDRLADKIERAEAFYGARASVPRFQLTDGSLPSGLREALASRGYREHPGALVQTVRLEELADDPAEGAGRGRVQRSSTWHRAWLAALGRGSGAPWPALETRAANLTAVPGPKVFLAWVERNAVLAVGFVAVTGPWAGVFNMATVPEGRRRGAASRVLRAAATWGLEHGACEAYLQVHPDNAAALALYAKLGFTTHHAYTYWEAAS